MASERLRDDLGIPEDLINVACSFSIKAHGNPNEPFLLDKSWSGVALIAFPGSWSLGDWYSVTDPARTAFGESQVDLEMFPCLRSIGNDEVAKVKPCLPGSVLVHQGEVNSPRRGGEGLEGGEAGDFRWTFVWGSDRDICDDLVL
ncbi:hypothetical protein MLD38_026146 [Melastoma candidum]|uniref:Uncharacterized protein n=1 Tax=Melastoma candidum TaxID=119954 RepID=A0ACB9P0U3_9MYRT|nr:hypothetical protein MLD38_026146 [Melastoma candidum]